MIFKKRRGMSPIIEMVFTLPLFLGIFFAITYYSILLNQQITLNNITREGVRIVAKECGMSSWYDDMVDKMKMEATGSAIDVNSILDGTKGTMEIIRIGIWDQDRQYYQPDNTLITKDNASAILNFHDRIQMTTTYTVPVNTIFLGNYNITLKSVSTYLVEYVKD